MSRIDKLRIYIENFFLEFRWFGYKVASRQFVSRVFKCGDKAKHKAILEYLAKHYKLLIAEYKEKEQKDAFLTSDSPIWICWFQGEENMPPIVKGCFNSVKKHAGQHPVKLITEDNYKNYVNIPDYIIRKLKDKNISYTHFSDIIRNNLLADHGGIWMDASIFLTGELKDWNKPFYTIKQDRVDDCKYVSGYRWTGFCMGGSKGNVLNSFVRDLFNAYHIQEKGMLDYLLIDYIIALGYNKIPSIKELIDNVPYSNPDLYYIQQNMVKSVSEEELGQVLLRTSIFKLNWRVESPSDTHALYYRLGFNKNK